MRSILRRPAHAPHTRRLPDRPRESAPCAVAERSRGVDKRSRWAVCVAARGGPGSAPVRATSGICSDLQRTRAERSGKRRKH
jgi:hypothetical protein